MMDDDGIRNAPAGLHGRRGGDDGVDRVEGEVMLESLENLRKDADHITEQAQGNDYSRVRNLIAHYAQLVQDEVDERYMPLPLDADGVPIRVGDTVEYSDGYEMWTMRVGMIGRECVEECESGVVAKICHHVKPRTVEDVLREFAYKGIRVASENGVSSEFRFYPDENALAEYAAEIRGMMGVDDD